MSVQFRFQANPTASPLPFTPTRSRLLQRCTADRECDECREKRLGIQRFAASNAPISVPPLVNDVLHSSGQPLEANTRGLMESRFGYNFGNVRIHTDARAAESARAVNALAYTVGRDMVFGAGQYSPRTREGQKMIAHELTHVVQQSWTGGLIQQNFAISEPSDAAEAEAEHNAAGVVAGLTTGTMTTVSGNFIQRAPAEGKSTAPHPVELEIGSIEVTDVKDPACKYEQGEKAKSHTAKGILDLDVAFAKFYGINTPDDDAVVIADYGVDEEDLKPSSQSEFRTHWLGTFKVDSANPLELIGYSDCVGWESHNAKLRQKRAQAVAPLFAGSGLPISFVGSMQADQYLTENTSAQGRALNRSVIIRHKQPTRKPEPKPVPPKPTPETVTVKLNEPDTENCSPEQRKRLAVAFPAAKMMIEFAISMISNMEQGSDEEALFIKYFGKDAFAHRWHIKKGYVDTLRAWSRNPTFECHKQEGRCEASSDHVTLGYIRNKGAKVFGGNIHMCAKAFEETDLMLADVVLHEASHLLDWTTDKKYCKDDAKGCSLSTADAEDNADSYSVFARRAFNIWYR